MPPAFFHVEVDSNLTLVTAHDLNKGNAIYLFKSALMTDSDTSFNSIRLRRSPGAT